MNENDFRLKTSAISVKTKNEQRKQKQNQENDAATLAKAKETVEKNDITKCDLKVVSDAFGKCLNEREPKQEGVKLNVSNLLLRFYAGASAVLSIGSR